MRVTSSARVERLLAMLATTKLDRFFPDRIYSADAVTHGKPAPDLFLYAAERMQTDPSDYADIDDLAQVLALPCLDQTATAREDNTQNK